MKVSFRVKAALNTSLAGLILAGSVLSATGLSAADATPAPTPVPNITPSTPPPGSSFDQRLAIRKQEQNVLLSSDQEQQLQSQCVNTQGILRQLLTKTTPILSNRNATYVKIDGTVWVDIGQLKLATKDTFQLEQERLTLSQDMATFKTTAANYQQDLNDALEINCRADIVGFMAFVYTARDLYAELQTQADAITNYTTGTVQPTIQNYISQLQTKNDATSGQN